MFDRRYEGNRINALENIKKNRLRIIVIAKQAAPVIIIFRSKGDTATTSCIKSLQKPIRGWNVFDLSDAPYYTEMCPHSSPFVPLHCFLWFSIQARVHWARLWCLHCCLTRTSQNMVPEACFLVYLLHGKYSVYWKIHSVQFKNLSEWPAKSK